MELARLREENEHLRTRLLQLECENRVLHKLERTVYSLESALETLRSRLFSAQREKVACESTLEKVRAELKAGNKRSDTVSRLTTVLNNSGCLTYGLHLSTEKLDISEKLQWADADIRIKSQLKALRERIKTTIEGWEVSCSQPRSEHR